MGAKKACGGSGGGAAHRRTHHMGAGSSTFNNANSRMVKNIHGTSAARYTIPRLHHAFKAEGGTASATCQAKGCSATSTATAHVRSADGRRSGEWLLTRFCASHNSHARTDAIPLRLNAKLIPVTEITGS